MSDNKSRGWSVAMVCLSLVLPAACQRQQPEATDTSARASNPAKYDRDRDYCRAQTAEYMSSRRTVDDSRNEVFRGDRDRFGQGELPSQMSAYGDVRSSDRFMSDCMEARGWPQPAKSWWQRTGTGFKL
jgi:hypothetical protein